MNYAFNLATDTVQPCTPGIFPWEVTTAERPPADKKLRSTWATNPSTRGYVYSLLEGVNPHLRINKDSNPVCLVHGLVVDFDHNRPDSPEVQAGLERMRSHPLGPCHIEISASGNQHAIWLFEQPLPIPGDDAFAIFAEFILKQKSLPLASFLPGLEISAFTTASRRYTNSLVWLPGIDSTKRLSSDLVRGWWIEASKKIQWQDMGAADIPLDVIKEELEKRYPNFNWPGEFVLDSHGPSFWLPDSASPTSAILHETGFYTFSAHAGKPWWSWQDLLGEAFIEQFRATQTGRAVEGIYYDGLKYWRTDAKDFWRDEKEGAIRRLLATRGLSDRRARGARMSAIDEALHFIHNDQRIAGAGPCVFVPAGIMQVEGEQTLNISGIRAMPPAEELTPWGPTGKFALVSSIYDDFFTTPFQLRWFLAWLQRYYRSALALQPEQGHALFIAGEVGTGKSFLCEILVGEMFSGTREASSYLADSDKYGGELFDRGILFVDDAKAPIDVLIKQRQSENIKALVSKHVQSFHKKFNQRAKVWWIGRLLICLNVDPHSIEMLPALDMSNDDKVSFLRCSGKLPAALNALPTIKERREAAIRELPHFCRWLLAQDFSDLPPDPRYGILKYRDPSLEACAQNSSAASNFRDLMEAWRTKYLATHSKQNWVGSVWDLTEELSQYCAQVNMRAPGAREVQRGVMGVKRLWPDAIQIDEQGTRSITVLNPAVLPPAVMPALDAKWSKNES